MHYNWSKTQKLVLTGMFGAIIFLLTFTPIGFVQVPIIGSATTMHIPVIIGAILLGPKYGAILGFFFGLSSFIFASTLSTTLTAFAFTPLRPVPGTDSGSPWALLIAFGPRILVGVVAPLMYTLCVKILPSRLKSVGISMAAIAATATNTLLVVHMLFFLFRAPWTYARVGAGTVDPQITYTFIARVMIGTFGVAEAIIAAIVAPAVCMALFMVSERLAPRRQVGKV